MSKPAICLIHGSQNFTVYPPAIIDAIASGKKLSADQIFEINTQSERGTGKLLIDSYLSEKLFNGDPPKVLIDRDKKNKKMNDRLKLRELISELRYACPVCAALTLEK